MSQTPLQLSVAMWLSSGVYGMCRSDGNSIHFLQRKLLSLPFFFLMASYRLNADIAVVHLHHMDKDELLGYCRAIRWKEPGPWRALSFRTQSTLNVKCKKYKHLSCLTTVLRGAYLL